MTPLPRPYAAQAQAQFRTGKSQGNLARTPDVAVVTPLNNFLGPEGDTVTMDEQLLNTEKEDSAGLYLKLAPTGI